MRDYVIYTDTGCDISKEILREWGVRRAEMTFNFDDDSKTYTVGEMGIHDFYLRMKNGWVAHTAAINMETFTNMFARELEGGRDVLYIAFSSGLSSTYSSAYIAAQELRDAYPDNKVVVVDSLAASAGQGMLVYLAAENAKKGMSIDENAKYCEDIKNHICHWFTVDDLMYLKRGGRLSATAAIAGAVLGIKPVLHVDDEGHLINMQKIRGRNASVKALAEKLGATRDESLGSVVFISHANCEEDAKTLAGILKKDYGTETRLITDIGPIIGAHAGPGTLALFFLGTNK